MSLEDFPNFSFFFSSLHKSRKWEEKGAAVGREGAWSHVGPQRFGLGGNRPFSLTGKLVLFSKACN